MILYGIISFFLEYILSNLFDYKLFIIHTFLIFLIVIYQKRKIDIINYLVLLILLSFIYDIVYKDNYIDTLLFPIIGFINYLYTKNMNNTFLSNLIFIMFAVFTYEFLNYGMYVLLGISSFDALVILKTFLASFIFNSVYYFISNICIKNEK